MTTHPYFELPGLDQVYLEDSFVLDVLVTPGAVKVFLDVVLREGHPEYVEPVEGEQYCFRKGVLHFHDVTAVQWRLPEGRPAIDASGETDYGGLDEFVVEGPTRRLSGEIGELLITCGGQGLGLDPAS
jgi:hypothetical protein